MSYRVDFIDGQVAKCFGFMRGDKAWEKFVEGVSNAYDEVCIYQFDGGAGSAVLLARFYFKTKRIFHGRSKEIKAGFDPRAKTQIQSRPD